MKNIEIFLKYLCGNFDNKKQIEKETKNGKVVHPNAKHITNICNDKIKNIPQDFAGYFVLEESYYEQNGRNTITPHLFLFTENDENKIVLTSYEIPKEISKEDFKYSNNNIIIDYTKLEISEKFTPMVYEFVNNGFEGKSVNKLTPELTFTLTERTEKDTLYVSEVFEKNGKITFGFPEPIIYNKI